VAENQSGRHVELRSGKGVKANASGCAVTVMSLRTLLIILVILLLIGALPTWPYSNAWGYYPAGGLGIVLLVLIVLALL